VTSSPATGASSMRSNVEYVESLELFGMELGLERMRELLAQLGDPQEGYPAVHVVGTNGKTTTTLMTAELLAGEGLRVGAYVSPHVTGWSERIRVDGEDVDFDAAIRRVRSAAEAVGATQFEVVTAAALAEFADARVDVAVVEAGLGGRLDATNVLRSRVVVLTNVELEHTEHLGSTREEISAEKLAVLTPEAVAVLGEPEWEDAARRRGARDVVIAGRSNLAAAVAAAEAFLGREVQATSVGDLTVPGRLEVRGESPLEIWDGAHNLAAVGYALPRLPARDEYVLVLSILDDKNVDGMLAAFSVLGDRLVATTSPHSRALPAEDLARRAQPFFRGIEVVPDPAVAVARGRALAGPEGALLVSGSLYLLAAVRPLYVPWDAHASG
jgi:dihydrofolate synthase / folylpolyglutamate synthase